MKLKWILATWVVCCFFLRSTVFAEEIKPFFRGVRAQAMGGAGVATVNDETALFINPAGLGKIRGPYFALINPEIEANYDTNLILTNSETSKALTSTQGLLDAARRYPDKPLHARLQAQPTFLTTNFAIGAYGAYKVDGLYNPSTNIFHLDYVNDYAAAVGYCFRLFEGKIKIGVAGKILNRVYVNQDIDGNTTNLELKNIAAEGTGVGWDAGVLLTGPWKFLPSIGAVAHDIGKTYFNMGDGYFYKTGIKPPPQNQSIDVAMSISPIFSNSTRSSFTVEWRDVQNPEKDDAFRRIHVGAEVNFSDVFFLRGGMNQRYYTAGIELSILRQQFQLTTYGEEIGTATRNLEDRRFILQYGFRF